MAITTLDGLQAGLQPVIVYSKTGVGNTQPLRTGWEFTGFPEPGSYDNTLNGVTCDSTTTGALPWVNPASGNSYLARLEHCTTFTDGYGLLCDRLWHNGNIDETSTSAQAITSPTWPARDIAGATDGDGVLLCLEVSSAMGAATPTITVEYTNSAGTSGRTATNIYPTVSASQRATVVPIGLQAGDTGVRSVQSITLSASWISGECHLVAYRPIQMFKNADIDSIGQVLDAVSYGMYRIFNSPCLYFQFQSNTTNNTHFGGGLSVSQG